MDDLMAELAKADVPPPPPELDRRVHESVNRALLVAHIADLVLRAMTYAAGQFAAVVYQSLRMTITGRWPEKKRDRSGDHGNRE